MEQSSVPSSWVHTEYPTPCVHSPSAGEGGILYSGKAGTAVDRAVTLDRQEEQSREGTCWPTECKAGCVQTVLRAAGGWLQARVGPLTPDLQPDSDSRCPCPADPPYAEWGEPHPHSLSPKGAGAVGGLDSMAGEWAQIQPGEGLREGGARSGLQTETPTQVLSGWVSMRETEVKHILLYTIR